MKCIGYLTEFKSSGSMVRTICFLHLSLPDTTHGRFKYHEILTGDHTYTTGVQTSG